MTKVEFSPIREMQKGVDLLANAVKVTLGPRGKNVVIRDHFGDLHITKDGVTVAKAISPEGDLANMGANLVKEASMKTNELAGDGTTTSTVLAQALLELGIKAMENGANVGELNNGIQYAWFDVFEKLKEEAIKCTDKDTIRKIASISANNDAKIGNLIANAFEKTDIVTVVEGKSTETYFESVKGIKYDRGYTSPLYVTNVDKMAVEYENCLVLVIDYKLQSFPELAPVLEAGLKTGKPILIIADDATAEVQKELIYNRVKNQLPICFVKAPGYGDRRKDMLEDIAIILGGKLISEEKGTPLTEIDETFFGKCDSININKTHTTIIGGEGIEEEITNRIMMVKALMKDSTLGYDKNKLEERLARLTNGISTIYVGATTEIEAKELKDRVDDAVNAVKAAIEAGYHAGAGYPLLRASYNLKANNTYTEVEKIGYNILLEAISAPAKTILKNANIDFELYVVRTASQSEHIFVNCYNGEVSDLLKEGIIDPVKVTTEALRNAVSVVTTILTTECAVYTSNQKEE
jgi:chaperonin GroEL